MSMKKYDEAINVFSKRINMCEDTNSVKSIYYIGNCLYSSAKHDSAIIVFKDYLTKEINSIPARITMYNSFNAIKKKVMQENNILLKHIKYILNQYLKIPIMLLQKRRRICVGCFVQNKFRIKRIRFCY